MKSDPQAQPIRKIKIVIFLSILLMVSVFFLLRNKTDNRFKVTVEFRGTTNASTTYTTKEGTFPVTYTGFRVCNVGNSPLYQSGVYACEGEHQLGVGSFDQSLQSTLRPGQSKTVWA